MSKSHDAIVIGAGHVGPPLADRLNSAGLRVALIERKPLAHGSTNSGALAASARVAHLARKASEFGLSLEPLPRVELPKVMARMKEISLQSRAGIATWIERLEHVDLITGSARLVGPNAVEVDGTTVTADKIFLNVGTRPRVPAIPGIHDVPFLTTENIHELDALPEHLVVLGGGHMGLEFAQTFRRLGSKVTLIEIDSCLLGCDDEDVSANLREVLVSEGVRVRTGTECVRLAPTHNGVRLDLRCNTGAGQLDASHLFVAVGQSPNTESLGLEQAHVATDSRGYIQVDDQLVTSAPGIWALGNCNGRGLAAQTAFNDFEIVAANLLDQKSLTVADRIPCSAVFTDPPLGRVGMTEREARNSGREVLVGKWPMSNVASARECGEPEGFMKILVDANSEQLLGATVFGMHGDEVVHALLDAMYAQVSYKTLARAMHIQPTVSTLIPTTLQHLTPLE